MAGWKTFKALFAILLGVVVFTPSASGAQLTARSVAVGNGHACAVRDPGAGGFGQAVCWGYNYGGALGDGSETDRWRPVPVSDLGEALTVTAGDLFSCGVEASVHGLLCWGAGTDYRLGNNLSIDSPVPSPVRVDDPPNYPPEFMGATAVSAGGGHGCAIERLGQLFCWGRNNSGQVGTGPTSATVPVATPVGDSNASPPTTFKATAVATGDQHTCAIEGSTTPGRLFCWGSGEDGRLGLGHQGDRDLPAPVVGPATSSDLLDATAVSAGLAHTCAILGGMPGTVWCWGSDSFGQLGNGAGTGPVLAPAPVPDPDVAGQNLDGIVQIAAARFHTCALSESGEVFCWGNNSSGELGIGTGTVSSSVPVPVADPDDPDRPFGDVLSIAAGGSSSCAVVGPDLPGRVFCWGWNSNGRLGDGTETDRNLPTPVLDGRDELRLASNGSGTGSLSRNPAGTACGPGCFKYEPGTEVTLTATPDAGSAFTGWSGGCSGVQPVCEVTVDGDVAVTAGFALEPDPVCPDGRVGIPPDCKVPETECPEGQVGTPPDCRTPASPACPDGVGGTSPDCRPVVRPLPVSHAPKVTVKRTALRRDRPAVLRVRVKNRATVRATGVRVCLRAPKRLIRAKRRCLRLGAIGPRRAKMARFRLRTTRQARRGQRVKLTLRTVSTVLKTKHDTVKSSIVNIR